MNMSLTKLAWLVRQMMVDSVVAVLHDLQNTLRLAQDWREITSCRTGVWAWARRAHRFGVACTHAVVLPVHCYLRALVGGQLANTEWTSGSPVWTQSNALLQAVYR